MADILPYYEGSPEFAEMLEQAEAGLDGGAAAFAAGNCYMYGSHLFCKDWYECFVLKKVTVEEYKKHLEMVTESIRSLKSRS